MKCWSFSNITPESANLNNYCSLLISVDYHDQHHHERHGKYRLEDEDLTHLGQSLGEMDKFDDVQLSDDDDVDNNEDGGKVMLVFSVICITENSPPL